MTNKSNILRLTYKVSGGTWVTDACKYVVHQMKTCSSCKCPREAHDVVHEEWVNVRERLGFDEPATGAPGQGAGGGQERSRAEGYAWVPPGLPSHKIETYFSQLPAGKVPKLSSAGEKYRDRQLLLQLPKQDLALAYCKHVEAQHSDSYEDFIAARNEIALDIGYVTESQSYGECPQCQQTVDKGDVVVIAPKLGPQTTWHPACFTCCSCQELLVDLTYCVHDDQLYCERHYAEKFATRCVKCNKIITSGGVTYKNEPWHRECFTCTHCNTSLAGQRFTSRDEKPYCADCFGELFAKRCTACSKPITGIGGTRFISFEDRHWHNDCFICASCKTSLVGRGFITDADDIICPECAKQKLM